MVKFIKEHKITALIACLLIAIDSFVILMALTPSNKDITCPGGLNEVISVIDAETNTQLKGSFNTIYVYSIERASILQTFVADFADYNEISDSSPSFHLSLEERRASGIVQKNQSIEASIIYAYRYANQNDSNIKLNHKFSGLIVYNYQINNELFKIGDIITSLYDKDLNKTFDYENNPNELYQKLFYQEKEISVGDKITYLRGDIEITKEINKPFSYSEYANRFYVYPKYEINHDSANPSYKLFDSTTYGPSGGFMQTLSIYSQITNKDYTYGKKIVGTGTMDAGGNVGIIGGISQKVATAIFNKADVFFCPEANWKEGYETYLKTPGHEKMHFIKVKVFEDAIESLRKLYEN